MKLLRAALAATTLLALATPALAQDRDQSGDYNGPYIGVFVGDAIGNHNGAQSVVFDTNRDGTYDNTVLNGAGTNAFAPGFCKGTALGNSPDSGCRSNKDGLEYGVRLGLDKRMGNFVLGGLVEGSKNNAREGVSGFSTTPASYALSRKLDYNVAARLRAGITPGGGGLFYVTGGATWGKIKHDFATTNTANTFTETNDNEHKWGWQAGGGAEVMLGSNLSLGLEYLYNRYNDDKYYVAVAQGSAPATGPFGTGTNLRASDTKFDYHSIRATMGLRF